MRVWLLAVAWGGSAVLEYTDANFDAGRKEHTHLLVFFHAPWCGHCRQLTPDFERAAQSALLKFRNPKSILNIVLFFCLSFQFTLVGISMLLNAGSAAERLPCR